jgi:histone H1/5
MTQTKTVSVKKLSSKVKKISIRKSAIKTPAIKETPIKPPAAKRVKSNFPTFAVMIANGIRAMNEPNGSSRQAILKYIIKTYNLDEKLAKMRSKLAFRAALKSGLLKYGKTTGLFKIGEKVKGDKKKEVKNKINDEPKKNIKNSNVLTKPEVKNIEPETVAVVKRKALKSVEVKKVPVVAAKSVLKTNAKKTALSAASNITRNTRFRKVAS